MIFYDSDAEHQQSNVSCQKKYREIAIDEQIGRFQIAMNDARNAVQPIHSQRRILFSGVIG
jgi:hypothetical protein